MSQWDVFYKKVVPYIVRIETPEGSGSFGTGFLFAFNRNKRMVGFATAAHVIQHADAWRLPIKLTHHLSGEELFLTANDRVIELDTARDSANILTPNPSDYLPKDALSMMDAKHFKAIGTEVAWMGYPVIAHPNLCLFSGNIAAFVPHDDSYWIDGVAINGVSGGPLFCGLADETPQLLGTISSYMPNRLPTDTLPGMLRAHDITSFAKTMEWIKSLDEARENKEKEEQDKRQAEAAGTAPPTPSTTSPQEPRVESSPVPQKAGS